MKNLKYTSAPYFKNGSAPADTKALVKMTERIKKLGQLSFVITTDAEGWTAQCNEVEAITTGGKNQKPTDYEIESQIRDAIHTAFHVPVKNSSAKLKRTISELTLSLA